jgi:hypothetical protein
MPLPEQPLASLRELLKLSTARIVPESGKSHGTGFFIDERLLLTCAHVVKGAAKGTKVEVWPFGRKARTGTVWDIAPAKDLDVALIEAEPVDGEEALSAVALDHAMGDDISYYAVGYPKNPIGGEVGLEEIRFTGHRSQLNENSVNMLLLESGKGTVGSGLSGGPVMNAESGAVVALVQYSNATSNDAGGGAIPIARAAEQFATVRRVLEQQPPVATRRWRDTLGREGWEGLGKTWEWRRWVDIVVDGSSSCWRVKIDTDDFPAQSIRASNLPDEVAEALFRWSQRRRIRDPDEVRLLGRLLAGAVLTEDVRRYVWENRLADKFLLRLRVDGDSDLFDVPWEFVTMQTNGEEKYLAAEEGFAFVRIAPHPEADKVSIAPSRGEALVVGISVQPKTWQKFMPTLEHSGTRTPWPKIGQVALALTDDIALSRAFKPATVEHPTPFDVQKALAPPEAYNSSIEIVHYLGFGQVQDNGKAVLAFSDGNDGDTWREAEDVFDWVGKSNARVLVVELLLPRWDSDYEPIHPRTFLRALVNRVNAVIFTRFPVHPHQCRTFNNAFYRVLATGGSVEAAVQQARTEVQKNEHLGDAAGFGSFTIITGPKSDTRIAPHRISNPLITGSKQTQRGTGGRSVATDVDERVGEVFTR